MRTADSFTRKAAGERITGLFADGTEILAASDPASWADPLTRRERAELARILARNCKRFWDAYLAYAPNLRFESPAWRTTLAYALAESSAEMSGLHLDVTERAAVATS